MSEHFRYVPRVRRSFVVALALALLVVPAVLLTTGGPWGRPDAGPVADAPRPSTEPTPTAPSPTAPAGTTATPRGPGGRVTPGTELRREPAPRAGDRRAHAPRGGSGVDDRLTRALRRRAQALLDADEEVPVAPAPPEVKAPEPRVPLESAAPLDTVAAASFRVSSFNILGAAHTRAGGTRPGFAPGRTRMRWAMDLLRSAGVSVAGLQEFEPPQHAAFQHVAPAWDVFPGMKLSKRSLANSVVWNTGTWRLVEGHTIDIPYFGGQPKPMPYVLLRHLPTGRNVWFANFHNPASVRGPAGHWRRLAVARETALVNRLSARGAPVVMTGDMNARAEFFCPLTSRSRMHAANGGSRGGRCSPPANMGIDWILGSPQVAFAGHRAVRGGMVSRTTDHPFVWASATIGDAASR